MKFVRLAGFNLFFFCAAMFLAELPTGPRLEAQALLTARKGAEITAFGGYMLSDPDFGGRSYNGFAFGANLTLFPHLFVDPSIEVRYDHTSAATIAEHAFLVGPRVQKDYGRFHPYANFLFGSGGIDYNPPLAIAPNDHHDSGRAYSIGGGVDFDVTRNFSAKIDFQQQSWNLGKDPNFQPNGDYTLAPKMLLFGVTYRIPFAGLKKQRELR